MGALTNFYTTVLGATLVSSSNTILPYSSSSTLAFTPQLSVHVLNSSVARDRDLFGEDVMVSRQAATPKRAILCVEVRDVDAIWRRLRILDHGQAEDDGQETLGEVRVVRGRRAVRFVDLAGHSWEAW